MTPTGKKATNKRKATKKATTKRAKKAASGGYTAAVFVFSIGVRVALASLLA